MLYDPKWEKPEIKADPFSLESLIAWLEKQPASAGYCYQSNGNCLLAKYFHAAGYPNAMLGGDYVRLHGVRQRTIISEEFQIIPLREPHTFGAALERARALTKG